MNLRRHRKTLASLLLGAWLFALFVGVAHACMPPPSVACQDAGIAMGHGSDGDDDASGNCREFCSVDTPLHSKLQLVQDQPAGPPLLVASAGSVPAQVVAPAATKSHLAHPPADVSLLLRTLRLAL
jgi:hypothetical protein